MSHPDGRLPERTLTEIERAEDDIERAIVTATKRGVTTEEMALILSDYVEDLEDLGRVPTGWDGDDGANHGSVTGP